MPSLRSFSPTEKPSSDASTTKALMLPPRGPSGSVRAMTVYRPETPALVIHDFDPLRTQSAPSAWARHRIAAVSDPASRSERA